MTRRSFAVDRRRRLLAVVIAIIGMAAVAIVVWATDSPTGATASSPVDQLRRCRSDRDRQPTVVLVHGAWADASSWSGEVRLLQRAGFAVRAIPNPVEDLTTDARQVAAFLRSIDGPVVLVGHSYGGAVITNAAAGLSRVDALVYVDATAPAPGEANSELSGSRSVLMGRDPSTLFETVGRRSAPAADAELFLRKPVFVDDFASDLPHGEAVRLWASQRSASTAAFETPSRVAAWKTIPSWSFVSTGDRIITAASKLAMARRAHARTTVFRGGSHLSLISHPEAVAGVIASAVCGTRPH